jgi:energy-coupling factor transporter ATP-binding protein EcfA2
MGNTHHQFVRVEFTRFKVFETFTINLRHFNILVGPNNSGKSTILAAFRILAAALRKATSRKAEIIRGPQGRTPGYVIDLRAISIAEENIFYNYDDSEVATIKFTLSNTNELLLYFPEQGSCYLIPDAQGRPILTPTVFKAHSTAPSVSYRFLARSSTMKGYMIRKQPGWPFLITLHLAISIIYGITIRKNLTRFGQR